MGRCDFLLSTPNATFVRMLLWEEEKNDYLKQIPEKVSWERRALQCALCSCYDRIVMNPFKLTMPNRLSNLRCHTVYLLGLVPFNKKLVSQPSLCFRCQAMHQKCMSKTWSLHPMINIIRDKMCRMSKGPKLSMNIHSLGRVNRREIQSINNKKIQVNLEEKTLKQKQKNCCRWKAMSPEDMGHGCCRKMSQKKKSQQLMDPISRKYIRGSQTLRGKGVLEAY